MLFSRSLFVGSALAIAITGCRSTASRSHSAVQTIPLASHSSPEIADPKKSGPQADRENGIESRNVLSAAHSESANLPIDDEETAPSARDGDDLFAGRVELPLAELVAAVKAQNPSLQAAQAAWNAAVNKYPQAIALDDPMFQSMSAPATWNGASDVQASP